MILIGTFQNISPRLEEAAASLGAPRWRVALHRDAAARAARACCPPS